MGSPDSVRSLKRSEKEKSIPKFNRKTELGLLTRKRSDASLGKGESVTYISPRRGNQSQQNFFKSPRFEDVAQNFSSTLFEQSTERSTVEIEPINFGHHLQSSVSSTFREKSYDEEN